MSEPTLAYGSRLREELARGAFLPFIGVYDAYSATLAVRKFDSLFLSGFSFSASYYGLPDEGFIAWPDIVACAQRIRAVAPRAHLLVDMDDGYGDAGVAAHAAAMLESVGASGIVLEDQLRPKKCGHLEGKEIVELDRYLERLERVLAARKELVVIARTDASEPEERLRRARAFARTGADALLIDGLADPNFLRTVQAEVDKPLAFNQIAGGKSSGRSWTELRSVGITVVIYSTPCLFAAHQGIEQELEILCVNDGRLPDPVSPRVGLLDVDARLRANVATRRNQK